jgi:hypothetical protein
MVTGGHGQVASLLLLIATSASSHMARHQLLIMNQRTRVETVAKAVSRLDISNGKHTQRTKQTSWITELTTAANVTDAPNLPRLTYSKSLK